MGNDITINPLVIDTATDADLLTNTLQVLSIRWVSTSATTGDAVDVQDTDGTTRWESVANDARHVERDAYPVDYPLRINGLKVPTLGSGTVYIHLKDSTPQT